MKTELNQPGQKILIKYHMRDNNSQQESYQGYTGLPTVQTKQKWLPCIKTHTKVDRILIDYFDQ